MEEGKEEEVPKEEWISYQIKDHENNNLDAFSIDRIVIGIE